MASRSQGRVYFALKKQVAARYGITGPGQWAPTTCYWCGKHGTIEWLPAAPGGSEDRYVSSIINGAPIYCRTEKIDSSLEFDHLVPVSRGGSNDATNLVLACARCNASRGNRHRPPCLEAIS